MNTTLLLKTDKELKEKASLLAKELGIPLTTVINAYLRQFVRDREVYLSLPQTLSPKKMKQLVALSESMDKGKEIGIQTTSTKELFDHLGV